MTTSLPQIRALFLFQLFETLCLVYRKTSVLVSPPVVSLFGYTDLLHGATNCLTLCQGAFNFTKLDQNLLRTMSLVRHFYPL